MSKENPNSHLMDWPYIIKNWDKLITESKKVIIRSLRIGIPNKYRGKVWALLTNAEKAKKEADFKYDDLKNNESKSKRIIDCDVPRTYPSWSPSISNDKLESLRRLLNAYAQTDTEIGYTQGMNFIAAMFLIYQDEETAFWSFYSLMHLSSIPHRNFFADDFPKLRLTVKVLTKMIDEKFPYFSKCMKERQLDATVFAPQWLMVCFLNAGFDLKLSAFIFDQFLAYGVAPLLSFGLAILDLHQNILKKDGFESFLRVLSYPGNSSVMNYREKVNLTWNKYFLNTTQYDKMLKEVQSLEEKKK
ncbi:TBC domain containing protein [Tritrichomonas foetus]|uniref:TBC domain containing protein n=1 Tax=Tritrichomonas foetus TaxID=1144522 RepID=A0A1J4JM02_9EUKA|nr:TBC domain containing protein [Tritrichomonas foetus]|eukprot:OHS99721.1 TBC domain containing protein [Tritrichomonas foetus]